MKTCFCVALIFVSTIACANNVSTSWSTYQHDAEHSGFIDVNVNPDQIKLAWQHRLSSSAAEFGFTTQALTQGKQVFTYINYADGTDELFALDSTNGAILWHKPVRNHLSGIALANNHVYVQAYSANWQGDLIALNAADGKFTFKIPINGATPIIENNTIYTKNQGGVFSFNATNGKLNWQTTFPIDMNNPFSDLLALSNDYIICYKQGIYLFGKEMGQLISSTQNPYDAGMLNSNYVVLDAGHVLISENGFNSSYQLFNLNTASWELFNSNWSKQPSTDQHSLYSIDRGALISLNPSTFNPEWSLQIPNEFAQDEMVVTQNVIFLSTDKNIYAISKTSHTPVWSYPVTGKLSLGDGNLYVLTPQLELIAFKLQ